VFAVFRQLTDLVVVFPEAHEGEPTVLIGSVGRTDVEKTCPIGKLHNVIDIRRKTNVFVELLEGFVGGDAGPAVHANEKAGKTRRAATNTEKHRKKRRRMRSLSGELFSG
jgi:hypothetical protein